MQFGVTKMDLFRSDIYGHPVSQKCTEHDMNWAKSESSYNAIGYGKKSVYGQSSGIDCYPTIAQPGRFLTESRWWKSILHQWR